MSHRLSNTWVWLRCELAGRKWIVWVALLFLLLVAVQIGVSLLPHHVLNTMLEFEEKSNGIREFPNGVREGPITTSR